MFSKYTLGFLAFALTITLVGCGGGGASPALNTNQFVPNGKSINGKVVNMIAVITPAQATAAALAAQPGTAGVTELGDENGIAVYDVNITASGGKMYDVKIDATTGKYLKSDLDSGTEGTEGSVNTDADGATGPNDQH